MTENISGLQAMSDFIFTSKYARYNEKLKRRETWPEAVKRVEQMHYEKYSFLSDDDKKEISEAFDLVRDMTVVPSMRSLQFGGIAIKAKNERIFNCSVTGIDSARSFAQVFFLALCGCGIGIGLQKFYISRLPDLVDASNKTGTVITYVIEDTIEGWADSIEALLNCYFKNTAFSGRKIVFDFSKIRKKGAKLKTGGGKAPGYKPLKNALSKIKHLLDDRIEKDGLNRLRSIDIFDIICHCADAVLAGGQRRSALSMIFDDDDELMINSKTGNWFVENPQRGRANISVIYDRKKLTREKVNQAIKRTMEFGEPGFVFANDTRQVLNPCFEISFIPITNDGRCGVQFCNLTSMNGSKLDSLDKFKKAVKAASIIGTLQAGYTHFPYLNAASTELTVEESLLGVSITGMMDNPDILLNPDYQTVAAKLAVKTNEEWAKKIGINKAARVTCIKPEGSSSVLLQCGSGIHPHHARKYFRRIQCNKLDNVYNFYKMYNPDYIEESAWSANKTDDVVIFPIEINDKAMIKSDLSALKHLDIIKNTQQNWVENGTGKSNGKPISHSVSCTVIVKDHEWDDVAEYLFKYNEFFTAVSLLPATGDKDYKQAPMEAVVTPEDIDKFEKLKSSIVKVDYSKLTESHDETNLQQEVACGGGKCEIV